MKKIRIKRWFENLLIIINSVCMFILILECDNLVTLFLSKIIPLGIFIINNLIILNHGRLFES